MKNVKLLLMVTALIISYSLTAQIGVNTDGSSPDSSAMLDIKSTTKGFLLPRMTTFEQRSISTPASGLLIFNTDSLSFWFFNGTLWLAFDLNPNDTIYQWQCGDDIDYGGQSYSTVQIGTQCWMAENLNIGTMINGSNNQTDNGTIEKYCYNNSTTNCDTYGGLYQWGEMMQYVTTEGTQGICPTGWHLPTNAEWCTLENYVDAGTVSCSATGWRGTDAGGNLKESGTTHWISPNTGATNSSGFTGLPGGYRNMVGTFNGLTIDAYFWSSIESGTGAWHRSLYYAFAQVNWGGNTLSYGFSVRCVRD